MGLSDEWVMGERLPLTQYELVRQEEERSVEALGDQAPKLLRANSLAIATLPPRYQKIYSIRLTRAERLQRCLEAGHSQAEIDLAVKQVRF